MNLDPLLSPRSIAILGASERGPGARVRESLQRLGFTGPVHQVNPRRTTVAGRPCYPDISSIGASVDLAVLALSSGYVVPALEQCASSGVRAAVVFAGGFAEAGTAGAGHQQRLANVARASEMSVLGPNCMGYVRPPAGHAVYLDHLRQAPRPGGVALVTQSGSVGVGALNHTGTLALSAMISVGNEAVVTAADVVNWLITDEPTRAIALFIEDTARVRPLLNAASRALDAGKPVVVCRSGRSEAGARAAQTHTGALATEDRALRTVLRAHGIVTVDDLDELCAAAEILATRRTGGRRLAGATVSGGHVGLLHDLAADADLSFPEPAAEDAALIEEALGEPRTLHNPLDAWADADVAGGFGRALRALQASSGYDAFVIVVDAPADPPTSDPELSLDFARSAVEAASDDERLWVITTSSVASDDPRVTALARASGIPRLTGLRYAMNALGSIVSTPGNAGPGAVRRRPCDIRLGEVRPGPVPATEAEGYELLSSIGVAVPEHQVCLDRSALLAAAEEIGFPLVAKAHRPGLLHKSAAGGVILGIRDAEELSRAFSTLTAGTPDGPSDVLLVRQADPGVDVLVGARDDPHVGPILLVGTGGAHAELIDDIAILPAPASRPEIEQALAGTRAGQLLAISGCGPGSAGLGALVDAIEAIGGLIASVGAPGMSLDVNPVRVTPGGALALDFAATGDAERVAPGRGAQIVN